MKIANPHIVVGAAALTLAAGSGFLAANALSSTVALVPQKTVTVNLATGPQGPPGPPGPPGASVAIKGQVATPADLPKNAKPGDTYIVSSDGSFQTWDGTKWVSSGPIAGVGSCPPGSTFGALVINATAQVTVYACIKD